jgi:hypothetical protein
MYTIGLSVFSCEEKVFKCCTFLGGLGGSAWVISRLVNDEFGLFAVWMGEGALPWFAESRVVIGYWLLVIGYWLLEIQIWNQHLETTV